MVFRASAHPRHSQGLDNHILGHSHGLAGELAGASMPMSGLLAVMAMGVMLLERDEALAERLRVRFEKLWVELIGSKLNFHEKLFSMMAYTPKSTVQAAIGAVPLAVGVESGELILAVAVLSILITAPLGATAIKLTATRLLTTDG